MTNNNQEFLSTKLQSIIFKINQACYRTNRNISDVNILPVTKKRSIEEITILKNFNFHRLGENNVQEIINKSKFFENNCYDWVMIGHAQTNKSKQIVKYCSEIQSLDRIQLAESLNKYLLLNNKYINATIEVKTSKEVNKHGICPENALDFIYDIYHHFPNIKIIGLMTIAENTENKDIIRSCFRKLRDLQNIVKKNIPDIQLNKLSMGMSNDFEIAIEEGATEIRLGSAIFD